MSNIIYGHHPVVEAIQAGKRIEKVLVQQGMRGEVEKEIRHLTKANEIPLSVAPREKMDRLVRGAHQGVIAWLALIDFYDPEDILPWVYERGETPLFLLLDGITDVRNFGAICRSAEVMGVHAIIIPQSGAAPANEEAMKASAGALAKIRLCRVRSLFSTIDWLKENGIQVIATALTDRSVPVFDIDLTEPTAIIMGSEGEGVHPKMLKMADHTVKIPQVSAFDSLNVSVAAGIALYEVVRQRKNF